MPRRRRVIPFSKSSRSVADAGGLVEVHRCDHAEAMVVKSLFESHAIPTLLRSRIAHSVHPFTIGSQGEAVIFVPQQEAARAARLLVRLVPDRGHS
jgi:hypothetical protein